MLFSIVKMHSFNCTILELKQSKARIMKNQDVGFNCTILELKQQNARVSELVDGALIVPFWN